MKLLFLDDFQLGVMKGNNVVDVSRAVSQIPYSSPQDLVNRLFEYFSQHRERIEQLVNQETGVPVDQVRAQVTAA